MAYGRNDRNASTTSSCAYCGAPVADTIDHVIPLSRSREFRVKRRVLDNSSNRVPACSSCNQEKGNMPPAEWFKMHPEYVATFNRVAKYLSNRVRALCGIL